jgi:hypothetical protein
MKYSDHTTSIIDAFKACSRRHNEKKGVEDILDSVVTLAELGPVRNNVLLFLSKAASIGREQAENETDEVNSLVTALKVQRLESTAESLMNNKREREELLESLAVSLSVREKYRDPIADPIKPEIAKTISEKCDIERAISGKSINVGLAMIPENHAELRKEGQNLLRELAVPYVDQRPEVELVVAVFLGEKIAKVGETLINLCGEICKGVLEIQGQIKDWDYQTKLAVINLDNEGEIDNFVKKTSEFNTSIRHCEEQVDKVAAFREKASSQGKLELNEVRNLYDEAKEVFASVAQSGFDIVSSDPAKLLVKDQAVLAQKTTQYLRYLGVPMRDVSERDIRQPEAYTI